MKNYRLFEMSLVELRALRRQFVADKRKPKRGAAKRLAMIRAIDAWIKVRRRKR